MTETMWKCEQLRAGMVYNRVMFNARAEAEQFAEQMGKAEPDLFWKIEAVPARAVWILTCRSRSRLSAGRGAVIGPKYRPSGNAPD